MKIIIYTYFMSEGTERLMPWRTLVETCKTINTIKSHKATIVSSSKRKNIIKRKYQSIDIIEIPYGTISFNNFFASFNFDRIFFPVSWRDGLKSIKHLNLISAEKIAYITGGIYSFKSVLSLLYCTNFSVAKPYILELLTPKKLIISKLKKTGFNKIITFASQN